MQFIGRAYTHTTAKTHSHIIIDAYLLTHTYTHRHIHTYFGINTYTHAYTHEM